MKDLPVQLGDVIDDKFRVERLLGQGNMGAVFVAQHVLLDQPCAIKIMFGTSLASEVAKARFVREMRVAAKLSGDHVAQVYDCGTLGGGEPWYAMELLHGKDLAAYLAERGPLDVREAVELVLQACAGLAEAHAAGIVHRDMKPANLVLTEDVMGTPVLKIVDFGVAKLASDDARLTKTGDAIGSPLYMAPEQINACKDVDGRADVWALGVVLYELLAGKTPFHAGTVMQLCVQIFQDPPAPLSRYRPDVPAGLEAIVMQCLEKDRDSALPDDRRAGGDARALRAGELGAVHRGGVPPAEGGRGAVAADRFVAARVADGSGAGLGGGAGGDGAACGGSGFGHRERGSEAEAHAKRDRGRLVGDAGRCGDALDREDARGRAERGAACGERDASGAA